MFGCRAPRLSALVIAALVLAGCSAGGGEQQGNASASTLVVDANFVLKTADPGRAYEPTASTMLRAIYDTLLTFEPGKTKTPVPSLASSYTASDDATTYTFTLRDDVVFSDGSPLTAQDVVFSLNRVRNLKSSSAFLLEGIEVSAPEEHTVVLSSQEPKPAIPALVTNPSLGILNADVVKEHGGSAEEDAAETDKAQSYLDKESAGSGPYVLESFSTTTRVVLEANPKYWGPKPGFDRIVMRNVKAQEQKLNIQKAQGHEVALGLSGRLLADLPETVQVVTSNDSLWFIYANDDPAVSEVTSNPDFQEAVRYALNYDGLVTLAGEGAKPAPGVVASAFLGALPVSEAPKRDLARAKAAIARSGLDKPTVDLVYPTITFSGIDFGTIASRIQSDLAEAGITVQLQPKPLPNFLTDYRGGKSQMGLTPSNPSFADPAGQLTTFRPDGVVGDRVNYTAERASEEVLRLSDEAATAVDPEDRDRVYQEWQRALMADAPYFPLFQPASAVVATADVAGLNYTAGWQVTFAALRPA